MSGAETGGRFLGQALMVALYRLLAGARIHQENNKLLLQAVENFITALRRVLQDADEASIILVNGSFYLQQDKIHFQRNALKLQAQLVSFFERRHIHGLLFTHGTMQAPARRIILMARILNAAGEQEEPRQWLSRHLSSRDFRWMELVDDPDASSIEDVFTSTPAPQRTAPTAQAGAGTAGTGEVQDAALQARMETRKKALRTYGAAMGSLRDMAQGFGKGKRGGIGKSVQLVQRMVDMIMEDQDTLLAMSTIRNHDDYTFVHSVNVAILSICLGARIGLSRQAQERLGLGALFHDLGKIDVPLDILNKPGKLSNKEFRAMRRHSTDSVRRIFRLRTSNRKKAAMLLPPFEHHLKYDLSGYPKTPRKKPVSLFGRIVTIADVYDAVTSNRVYRTRSLSPAEALAMMMEGAGRDFDPLLLKVFVNMLGIYPVGTVLKLDHNQLGIVARPPRDEERGDLLVVILEEEEDGSYQPGDTISLGTWNPERGGFNRRILETAHPMDYGIQPASIIL